MLKFVLFMIQALKYRQQKKNSHFVLKGMKALIFSIRFHKAQISCFKNMLKFKCKINEKQNY